MFATHRVLAVALSASAMLASSAAGQVAQTATVPCTKTFTLDQFKRAAQATYRGTRTPSLGAYGRLWRYERCQRQLGDQGKALRYWAREKAAWEARRHPWSPWATASWYDDSGATACGIHATYGFASLFLPCGAKITMQGPNGASVTAVMQDHGPYVGGRLFDLNPALRDALGCGGLCQVRYK